MAIWLSSGWSHLCRNDVYVFQALLIKQKQKQKQNPVIHTRSHSTACRKKFYPGPVARSCHGAFVHAAHHGFCDYWLCWTQQITTPLVLHMEKAMAPHSSTLAWKIPWMEEPGGLQSMGSLELGTTEQLHFHFSLSCIGEGNGNPLQYSCLENPRDGGAWWAVVYGVTQSRTRLKWLGSSKGVWSRSLNMN